MNSEQALSVLENDLVSRGYQVGIENEEGDVTLRFRHRGQVIGSISVPRGIDTMTDEEGLAILAALIVEATTAARNEPILRPR